ncbi:MAG: uroporphyrinogen decarboxylase family protein, partial [Armatimonadota bacterium]
MTPRERWLACLQRKETDRIPTDYWATPEATAKLVDYLGLDSADNIYERLHIDRIITVGGRYVGPEVPEGQDIYGCEHREVSYGTGTYSECVTHPLAQYESVAEIEKNYRWPDPDWWDYWHIPEQVKGWEDHPIRGGGSEPFLRYAHLRGQEQAYMDMMLNPEICHHCLDILFELAYKNTERIYDQIPGQVLISYVAEDLGSQEDLLFSPDQIHEFLLPRMKRMMDLVHSAGAYVFHHSDGAIRKILPDMIEAGIDVLNPVQWRSTNMDRDALKRDFGDRIVFHGAMDNQYTLPFGTVEEVNEEVRDNIRILGEGGGYILAPCHNIQA